MISNASALQNRDGLALGYELPTGETSETLMFSGVAATGAVPNDMFAAISNRVGRVPEAAPDGARAMLMPPARDDLVLEDVCYGPTDACFVPYEKDDEIDETILVFQFGPAPTASSSNDVMYYNGAIGWLFTTDNPIIPTSLATMRPSRWDDLSALGPRVLPTVTTNSFHVKEIWDKIRSALKFGGAMLPVAEMAAAIIPGGQVALPFLAGANSAIGAANYIGDAADQAFSRSRSRG